jgi:hypothetical protein
MTTHTAPAEDAGMTEVRAELAPIGVQLWPTRSPGYADNFTLASVTVVDHSVRGAYVVWTYRNGKTRTFHVGESVTVQYVTGVTA